MALYLQIFPVHSRSNVMVVLDSPIYDFLLVFNSKIIFMTSNILGFWELMHRKLFFIQFPVKSSDDALHRKSIPAGLIT